MKKINLKVTCKQNRFSNWNSCKGLQNFVNMAAGIALDQQSDSTHCATGP